MLCKQAVKQLEELVASLPEGACADLLILPLYAAMPLELQVRPLKEPRSASQQLYESRACQSTKGSYAAFAAEAIMRQLCRS